MDKKTGHEQEEKDTGQRKGHRKWTKRQEINKESGNKLFNTFKHEQHAQVQLVFN